MSEVGQSLPYLDPWTMSGLPLLATEPRTSMVVWFVPEAEVEAASFDHLVGACEQQRWDRESEGFGGPEIDKRVELGGVLDRQVTGTITLENAVDIRRRPSRNSGKSILRVSDAGLRVR